MVNRKTSYEVLEELILSGGKLYTEDEARIQQKNINEWRSKVGAIDSKGWYPYKKGGSNDK